MSLAENLERTERRLLAVLEEAGMENVSALINTILQCTGNDYEVRMVANALHSLHEMGLVEFSEGYDWDTQSWMTFQPHESVRRIDELASHLRWSPEESIWRWDSPAPHLVALLTDQGETVAKDVLENLPADVWDLFDG